MLKEFLSVEIQKLEAFISLAETLNYTETAEQLFTTQGNISKYILSIEKDLMVQLFERAHRKISLTQTGQALLPYAKEIVTSYHTMLQVADDQNNDKNQTLSIYTIPTMTNYLGFQMITDFVRKHPELNILIEEQESNQLLTSLKNNQCDIVFARVFDPKPDKSGFDLFITETDQFVAVLPTTHPLAGEAQIDLATLKTENFLLLGGKTNLLTPAITLCEEAGFTPHITYEGTRADLIINMVANGLGIALLMKKTVQMQQGKFVTIPLTTNETSELVFVQLSAAQQKNESNVAKKEFWKFITRQAEQR